jgi:hypothetical protein
MERVPEFDEYLDMQYEAVNVVGTTFYPSQVLYYCDLTAYRIHANDYLDLLEEDK